MTGPLAPDHRSWALESPVESDVELVPSPAKPGEWQDARIGWGVILPERPGLDAAALARPDDAGEPIRALVDSRPGARVFRYRPGGALSDWTLRDYAAGAQPLTATAQVGTEPGQLPAYLLIVGGPAEIPWHVQYLLDPVRQVGRLDLDPGGLANYVTALMSDWSGAGCRCDAPVTWAVDTGAGDITTLMREAVAAPLAARFQADADMGRHLYLDGSVAPATGGSLAAALAVNKPALVVTSSHGMTGPLGDPDLMRSQLGMLVDQTHAVIRPEQLLATWNPDGAVWFAQACCSAGTGSPSVYSGLFRPAAWSPASSTGWPRSAPAPPRCRGRCWARTSRCARSSAMSSRPSTGPCASRPTGSGSPPASRSPCTTSSAPACPSAWP